MVALNILPLGEIMASRLGSVDPSLFPDETFDLYSIPGFDRGEPDVVTGKEIGSSKQIVQPGDVLLSKIVPHIRRSWIVAPERGRRQIASGEWIVFRGNQFDRGFLRRFLVSNDFHLQFMQTISGVGGSLLRARPSRVANIAIPLPTLEQQQFISNQLCKADELRAKRKVAIAEIEGLNKSIFVELFGSPLLNPKGWPLKKLSEVGSLDRGVSKHRPRNAPELLGGAYPLIQTGDIANCDGYIRRYKNTYSDVGLQQSKLWPAGTLCITIAANIAKTGILTFDACFPDSVVGFLSDEPAIVEYVRAWLSFLQKKLEAAAPEVAQKNINLAILRNLEIPFPPLKLQKEFEHQIKAVEKLKFSYVCSMTEMDSLFDSLQHYAFKGELKL